MCCERVLCALQVHTYILLHSNIVLQLLYWANRGCCIVFLPIFYNMVFSWKGWFLFGSNQTPVFIQTGVGLTGRIFKEISPFSSLSRPLTFHSGWLDCKEGGEGKKKRRGSHWRTCIMYHIPQSRSWSLWVGSRAASGAAGQVRRMLMSVPYFFAGGHIWLKAQVTGNMVQRCYQRGGTQRRVEETTWRRRWVFGGYFWLSWR